MMLLTTTASERRPRMVTILPALRQVREDLAGLLDRTAWKAHLSRARIPPGGIAASIRTRRFIYSSAGGPPEHGHDPPAASVRGALYRSAYWSSASTLPLELIQQLWIPFAAAWSDPATLPRWHGHRVCSSTLWFLDAGHRGTSGLFRAVGQQKPGAVPIAHMLAMLDARTDSCYDVIISPLRTHDMKPCRRSSPEALGERHLS